MRCSVNGPTAARLFSSSTFSSASARRGSSAHRNRPPPRSLRAAAETFHHRRSAFFASRSDGRPRRGTRRGLIDVVKASFHHTTRSRSSHRCSITAGTTTLLPADRPASGPADRRIGGSADRRPGEVYARKVFALIRNAGLQNSLVSCSILIHFKQHTHKHSHTYTDIHTHTHTTGRTPLYSKLCQTAIYTLSIESVQ